MTDNAVAYLFTLVVATSCVVREPVRPLTVAPLSDTIHWCALNCFTLHWQDGRYVTVNNGRGGSVYSIEKSTHDVLIMRRTDYAPNGSVVQMAMVSFPLANGGNQVVIGSIHWLYPETLKGGTFPFAAAWGNALEALPGSNAERARRAQAPRPDDPSKVTPHSPAPPASSGTAASAGAIHPVAPPIAPPGPITPSATRPANPVTPCDSSTRASVADALKQGKIAMAAAEISVAACWLRIAGAQGDAVAQGALAALLSEGVGIAANYPEAFAWAQKSAAQGWFVGEEVLSRLYANGQGTAQDGGKAAYWKAKGEQARLEALKSAERADGSTGKAQVSDPVVPCDASSRASPAEAMKHGEGAIRIGWGGYAACWFRIAAREGNADAQGALAVILYRGVGIAVNYREAFDWAEKAAAQGEYGGELALSFMYENGQGTARNADKARFWRVKSARDHQRKHLEGQAQNLTPGAPQFFLRSLLILGSDFSETGAEWLRETLQRYCAEQSLCNESGRVSDAGRFACAKTADIADSVLDIADYVREETQNYGELESKLDAECKASRRESCLALDPVKTLLADDRSINPNAARVMMATCRL